MTPLLEIRNVTKSFEAGGSLFRRRSIVALDDFSLRIDEDQPVVVGIAGESGSGKTTLARLLLGITLPTQGEILYRGQTLAHMPRETWRQFRREVQAIFQDPFEVYNPFYKVDHVLTTPVAKFNLAASPAEARQLIADTLRLVGLRPEETLGRYPHQLSGGQRQRAMIARALLLKPRIILADEPVSMVDASLRATILESLLKLNRELGISLVYITHDLTTAYQVCHNIAILYRGSVVEAGDVELVIKQPQHPYTQLLVASIPLPDPDQRWGGRPAPVAEGAETGAPSRGCKFAGRCPHVMSQCRERVPPLLRLDATRSAACFLYAGAPVADASQVMTQLSRRPQ